MMKGIFFSVVLSISTVFISIAQTDRWQQAVDYEMKVKLDVNSHQFSGTQELDYINNSPDTLKRVFYHLYFNAFQPGSMMDVRSRNIEDPDGRVGDRISLLLPNEIGFLKPLALTQNGIELEYKIEGTILEVELYTPILPNSKTLFEMKFIGQVPKQIRRSGRDNNEGIDYSMAQWYPKMCEYDYEGWHSNPYIGREFHGVWGNFDVSLTLNSKYTVAATGVLLNPNEIGRGYENDGFKVAKPEKTTTWRFIAENVHDFVWAADRDYVHKKIQVPNGPLMHFFYQEDSDTKKTWPVLVDITPKMISYMNDHFGKYPYSDYSVIQGGDGGMEYPMATLITGKRSLYSLVGVAIHEIFHSWYQGVLGSNESLYAWMDEGFANYGSALTMNYLYPNNEVDAYTRGYNGYFFLRNSGNQEPLTTHSDYYETNYAYGVGAYGMGSMVPPMLGYIVGQENFDKAFIKYFNTWKFKHPNPTDFKRVIEKETGFELDWYFQSWIGTTQYVDYGIKSVDDFGSGTTVTLERTGTMPMPSEMLVKYTDGSKKLYYMPLRVMRNAKTDFPPNMEVITLTDWAWTHPTRSIMLQESLDSITEIILDPAKRTADVNTENNVWQNNN